MKPFQCVLPATPVQILFSDLHVVDDRQQLRLTTAMRGEIQRDIFVGTSIADLIYQLITRFGFTKDDAGILVSTAQGGN